jgi:hypothetical protein
VYGWRIDDIYVWMPNMVGCVVAIIQLACKMIFPELPTTPSASPSVGYGRLPANIALSG